METIGITFFAVIFAIVYFWYASIIGRRNKVNEALSDIDVQFAKRYALIPNILKISQTFMDHERSLLEDITALRNKAQLALGGRDSEAVAQQIQADDKLHGMMSHFFALAENYPRLKSDATMVQAQLAYSETEEHIAAARRFYNAAVAALNNAIQIFPGTMLASMAGIKPYPSFLADEASKTPIDANIYLKRSA